MRTMIAAMAIASIAMLEAIALYRGIDGQALSLAVAAIAGIAGFKFGQSHKEGD